jgi:large subunit ribosomal protein L3
MRMAGQMGNVKATTVNLKVVEILPDDNAILVSGCVPGADGTLVIVRHSAKSRRVALEAKANG